MTQTSTSVAAAARSTAVREVGGRGARSDGRRERHRERREQAGHRAISVLDDRERRHNEVWRAVGLALALLDPASGYRAAPRRSRGRSLRAAAVGRALGSAKGRPPGRADCGRSPRPDAPARGSAARSSRC